MTETHTPTPNVDAKCDVIDEEVNVLKIIVKDGAENLYSIETLENVGSETDVLVHIDAKEVMAASAGDAKHADDLWYTATLFGADQTGYCFVGTRVIKECSIVHQDRANKAAKQDVATNEVDLVRVIFEDKQHILYHQESEGNVDVEHDNILDEACRAKIAEWISTLVKSGKPELTAKVSDGDAYTTVVVRFVADHNIVPRDKW